MQTFVTLVALAALMVLAHRVRRLERLLGASRAPMRLFDAEDLERLETNPRAQRSVVRMIQLARRRGMAYEPQPAPHPAARDRAA